MGSLLHLYDFNQGSMGRKIVTEGRDAGGLDAPRNSLELPLESLQSLYTRGDDGLFAYQIADDWTEKSWTSSEAPMRKLISEEISKRQNTRHTSPSVVARLMGVDMLPLDRNPVGQHVERKNELGTRNMGREEQSRKGSSDRLRSTSDSSRQMKVDPPRHHEVTDRSRIKTRRPKPREHPQEEELQKFKKEFEAWQAARFKECFKAVEPGSSPEQWLAQERLNKEKMVLYANSMRKAGRGRNLTATLSEREILDHQETKEPVLKWHKVSETLHDLNHQNKKYTYIATEQKDSFFSRGRIPSLDSKRNPLIDCAQPLDTASEPTKIVILRPGPDKVDNSEESWTTSPGTSEERGSIEDFLEEVKERLRCELQGKSTKRSTIARGGGIETPYSEKQSDPKHIAQCIAEQVRESVARDLGMQLLRSESTRSYRSEVQFNGYGSPEFVSRDTRRILAERLRNVLKEETQGDVSTSACGSSRFFMRNSIQHKAERLKDNANSRDNFSYSETQCRSFRHDPDDDFVLHEDASPRNLIRSLSAPVSGTSFGKLLLEDRHILTGAHIRRKHEAIEKVTVNMKKRRKEKSNFREKVSSFKYSFTLRGKLFGRKVQSVQESHGRRHDFEKDITSGPTVVMNFYDRNENSTEVPPSPASICSSVHEEFWRPAYQFSPSSISEVPSLDDSVMPHAFREISSNLNELRKQLNQLEYDCSEEAMIDELSVHEEEIEDEAEAYIRDLLVASGLYDRSFEKTLLRWEPLSKPISIQVFEEVEESYWQNHKNDEASVKDQTDKLNHKILFDLLNEALSTILGPPVTVSRFMKKAIGPIVQPLQGRKLLDHAWDIVRVHLYPLDDVSCNSIDSMISQDLRSSPWSGLIEEDINALGKDIEYHITGDLLEEIVKDFLS